MCRGRNTSRDSLCRSHISFCACICCYVVAVQGGASIAFPVMTLAFSILPAVARDFSFMIQSAGMTAAAATIAIMQVQVEMHSLLWATVGGCLLYTSPSPRD